MWQFLANLFNFLKFCWIFFLKQGICDRIFFFKMFFTKWQKFNTKRSLSKTQGKGHGIKWGAIGNMLGNTLKIEGTCWGNTLGTWEHVRTWWEHNGFNKNPKRETNVLPKEGFANSNYKHTLSLANVTFFHAICHHLMRKS